MSYVQYRTNEPDVSRSLQMLVIVSTIQSIELTAELFATILYNSDLSKYRFDPLYENCGVL